MSRSLPFIAAVALCLPLLSGCNRAEKEAREEVAKLQARTPMAINPLMTLTKVEIVKKEVRMTVAMDAKLALKVDAEKIQQTMRQGTCADEGMRRTNKALASVYLIQADGATFHTITVPMGHCDVK